ncbi:hypothetical protein AX14_012550 [Amanita brunnescens Koide BX004]|nr:hypothetical protein AX14_012550 [Amanita brunnescens Koide BX004]
MKSIQKRFYNALPRVGAASSPSSSSSSVTTLPQTPVSPPVPRARSNSLSSSSRPFHTAGSNVSPLNFFDTPFPQTSRSSLAPPSRLPIEAKPAELEGAPPTLHGQSSQTNASHAPLSLGVTQPPSNCGHTLAGNSHASGHHALFSYSLTPGPNLYPATLPTPHEPTQHAHAKKHKPKYQLYVGAYGIPKKCSANGISSSRKRGIPTRTQSGEDDMCLAVQVGEDAYFVRDNAMGVADGVGGWARVKRNDIPVRSSGAKAPPTPSALFARRLMHFCSAEVDTVSKPAPLSSPPSPPLRASARPQFSFTCSTSRPTPTPILASHAASWHWSDNILSTPFISSSLPSSFTSSPGPRKTDISELEQDLEDSLEELSEGIDVLQILERAYDRTLKAHVVTSPDGNQPPSPACSQPMDIPGPSKAGDCRGKMVPLMSGSSTALLAVLDHAPSDPSTFPSISATNLEAEDGYDAVIKIAHVGDCMCMLVRGEEMAWRSDEMWWDFNTPVQLGPSTPTTPRTAAHVFSLPVRADDILILASDGLSDNLWDEDVLDEVARFRKSFLGRDLVDSDTSPLSASERVLRRRTLAGMLSEALCSRARRVSERRNELGDEVPFARRAREAGKAFRGGKNDGKYRN